VARTRSVPLLKCGPYSPGPKLTVLPFALLPTAILSTKNDFS